jgi:hypothetical protein
VRVDFGMWEIYDVANWTEDHAPPLPVDRAPRRGLPQVAQRLLHRPRAPAVVARVDVRDGRGGYDSDYGGGCRCDVNQFGIDGWFFKCL